VADTTFGECEQRHRRRGEGGKADPDPARARVAAASERVRRLDEDEGDQEEVGGGDELLGAALVRVAAAQPVQPDDHETCRELDKRVEREARTLVGRHVESALVPRCAGWEETIGTTVLVFLGGASR
jgi:hypothetical protein